MKCKIDFKKLLCGNYWHFTPEIDLEMINWFFKTGLQGQYETTPDKWRRAGINQLLYGYSGNNEHSHAEPFPIESYSGLRSFTRSILINAIITPTSWDGNAGKIAEWRKNNRIGLDKYRMLAFPDPTMNEPMKLLWSIANFKGRELKKEFAHPDFPKRTIPRIIKLFFSTCGDGYFLNGEMSFYEFNYDPGWSFGIASQKEGEYIGDFCARALQELQRITVERDDWRLFEEEKHFIDFTKRGCFNCEWHSEEKFGICGLMYFHEIKHPAIDKQGRGFCDEWRLQGIGNGTSND
jgi:hypothetical protein